MTTPSDATKEFHVAYDVPIRTVPSMDIEEIKLRKKLITEEFDELMEAFESGDIINFAKEMADLVYVVYGTAHATGIPLDDVFDTVHESNMSKLGDDGQVIQREDGKILKGPNYFKAEPKIEEIIDNLL